MRGSADALRARPRNSEHVKICRPRRSEGKLRPLRQQGGKAIRRSSCTAQLDSGTRRNIAGWVAAGWQPPGNCAAAKCSRAGGSCSRCALTGAGKALPTGRSKAFRTGRVGCRGLVWACVNVASPSHRLGCRCAADRSVLHRESATRRA